MDRNGEIQGALIISPLVVEPSKPRLCINLIFLNYWIADRPVSLDTLKAIPQAIGEGALYMDDKNGLHNIFLETGSARLTGFQ